MENNKNDLVSIITPCYNGAKYLPSYFEGILAQKHKNIELIFVDDGSYDDTHSIALAYGEKIKQIGMQFVYIFQDNAGTAAAINKGLKIFKGNYLAWVDADDIMHPENISKKLALLKNHKEYDLAISEIAIVDSSDLNKVIDIHKRIKPSNNETLFEDLINNHNVVWGPGTVLVRREHLLKAIPTRQIYESREGQNYQLMLAIAYNAKCGYVEEPLLKCVIHQDSHSRKQRDLYELVNREKEFINICINTVNSIDTASNKEKEYWFKQIRIVHNKNILYLANNYRNKELYKYVCNELKKDGYKISIKDKYIFTDIKSAVKSILNT